MTKSKILLILFLSLTFFMLSSHIAPIVSAQSSGHGTISGITWIDANQNGIQEPSEKVASHVTVEVYMQDGSLIRTATTNEAGEYIISELSYGLYRVSGIEDDGAMTTAQTVELNEINGVAQADLPLKAPVMKYQFLPLVRR